MRSLKFPNILNSNSSNVWREDQYLEATKQNLQLLLQTHRGEILSDPYFGITLKSYMFDQNNYVLRDALIDVIYTQLAIFIPQLKVNREDITIINDNTQNKTIQNAERGKVYIRFQGTNQIDYTNNMFSLVLFENSDM